jgi:quercetin dioxygenase-like cupin family protein
MTRAGNASTSPPRHSRDQRISRGPQLRPLKRPFLTLDLAEEAAELRREAGWQATGHSAKTLAKHAGMTIVLVAMKRDTRMKEHSADGATSIQVLSGHIQLHVGTETVDLPVGSLLALDRGLRHDVEALADSAFVLSVSSASQPG